MPQEPEPAYTPNHIPALTRLGYCILSPAIVAYGAYGLWIDDLYVPGKRGLGVHLHGPAAWFLFAAMVCGALNMVSVVVDHFDTRNNETDYRRFAKVTAWAGYGLFALSLGWFIYAGIVQGGR